MQLIRPHPLQTGHKACIVSHKVVVQDAPYNRIGIGLAIKRLKKISYEGFESSAKLKTVIFNIITQCFIVECSRYCVAPSLLFSLLKKIALRPNSSSLSWQMSLLRKYKKVENCLLRKVRLFYGMLRKKHWATAILLPIILSKSDFRITLGADLKNNIHFS